MWKLSLCIYIILYIISFVKVGGRLPTLFVLALDMMLPILSHVMLPFYRDVGYMCHDICYVFVMFIWEDLFQLFLVSVICLLMVLLLNWVWFLFNYIALYFAFLYFSCDTAYVDVSYVNIVLFKFILIIQHSPINWHYSWKYKMTEFGKAFSVPILHVDKLSQHNLLIVYNVCWNSMCIHTEFCNYVCPPRGMRFLWQVLPTWTATKEASIPHPVENKELQETDLNTILYKNVSENGWTSVWMLSP